MRRTDPFKNMMVEVKPMEIEAMVKFVKDLEEISFGIIVSLFDIRWEDLNKPLTDSSIEKLIEDVDWLKNEDLLGCTWIDVVKKIIDQKEN